MKWALEVPPWVPVVESSSVLAGALQQKTAEQYFLESLRDIGRRADTAEYAPGKYSYVIPTHPSQVIYRDYHGEREPVALIYDGRTEGLPSFRLKLGQDRGNAALDERVTHWFSQIQNSNDELPPLGISAFTNSEDRVVKWFDAPLAGTQQDPLIVPTFFSVYYSGNAYANTGMPFVLSRIPAGGRVLVMGGGSGLDAVWIAKYLGLNVDVVDLNPIAVANVKFTAKILGLSEKIRVWESDLFSAVTDKYDAVIFFAPLAVEQDFYSNDRNRYDRGGRTLQGFLAGLPQHLNPGGRGFLLAESWRKRELVERFNVETLVQFNPGLRFSVFQLSSLTPGL